MAALPTNEECARVIGLLSGDKSLTSWEKDFIENNLDRTIYTTLQREVVARLKEKYECG